MTNRQLFLQNIAQTSDFPLSLEIHKAEGVYLYSDTKKYIDLISGIAVSNVGHRHPKVVEAIKNQVDSYMHLMAVAASTFGRSCKRHGLVFFTHCIDIVVL